MPRITTFKKPKLNRSRYHEHQQGGLFEEDLNNFSTSAVAIQINPKHVDLIMEEVIKKYGWKDKLELLEDKWKEECQRQGISKASVGVAFEILRDIVHQGKGGKICCKKCGVNPQPIQKEKSSDDEDEDYIPSDEETDEENSNEKDKDSYMDDSDNDRYDLNARFCECPCKHCAKRCPPPFTGSAKIKDGIIPPELKERLKTQLSRLENVPEEKKDWHPGTNRQVLDLIHPSLYCFVENVSVSDKNMEPQTYYSSQESSNRCQWLPAEFEIDSEKKCVKRIASYINNLDEVAHKDLYQTIQEIFSKFLPMLKAYVPLRDRLQVIVKAANIIVSPDKPWYSGGTFHTEGMDYEHIAATCIYYYHSENVKDSYLEFRESLEITVDDYYDEDLDGKGIYDMYGIHNGDLQFRNLGAIETKEDRCIVFPNRNQHRVRHFFPKDPSLPAIRKILVFFVVDPKHPIISTKNVDIQRFDFLMNKYFILNKILPFHIVYKILNFFPHMKKAEALKYREDLMNQRKFFINAQNEEIEREFSLCEH
ncbi:hypothetical protein FDP41_013615 [Naegleria fowleri]|uniref:DUF4246 domain-containing protein n=1 Tax=Naegleria fowleri TaxID=5763 RepID=A0A6A5C0G5_NAEFO|nr:uncharacterized protein FDP41_013615 [Naegleria fowleri]KAF0980401.1 hypothetical protein FDP41_013615 [Naegleria fowleri]